MEFKISMHATKTLDLGRESFPDIDPECTEEEFAEHVQEYYSNHPEDLVEPMIEWIVEDETDEQEITIEAT